MSTTYQSGHTFDWSAPWAATNARIAPAISLPRLLGNTVAILALLSLNGLGTAGAIAFFLVLGGMILRSPEAAYKALAICYLGLMMNTAFVPKTLAWTPGRLIIPYLALVRFSIDLAALRTSVTSRPSYIAMLVFVAIMAVCSLVSGWYTHIALLKLINFTLFITTIFAGTAVLRRRRSDIGEWYVSLILAGTLVGIAAVALGLGSNFRTIAVNNYGEKVAAGFNGAFLHPNAHATYASMFIAYLAIVGILSRYRRAWLVLPMLACWLPFIAWSASRTSFIASIVAIGLLIAYARPIRNRWGWGLRPRLNRGTLIAGVAAGMVAIVIWNMATGGSIGRSVIGFINKGGADTAELDADAIVASRKALIEYSWQNFQENPIFGIGFGVAKTEAFERMATLFTAPSEKGFLPTAILEEGGVLGTAGFLLFLVVFLRELARDRNVAGIVAFITFVITNVGEVTIFAPGGGGSFGWITVGAAMILGDRCWSPPVAMRPAGQVEKIHDIHPRVA